MLVTEHAIQRGKQRLGLSKKAMQRHSEKALLYGFRHGDFKGYFKVYLDYLYFHSKAANNIRIYGLNVFLFVNEKLITVFPVPAKHRKYVQKVMKNDQRYFNQEFIKQPETDIGVLGKEL